MINKAKEYEEKPLELRHEQTLKKTDDVGISQKEDLFEVLDQDPPLESNNRSTSVNIKEERNIVHEERSIFAIEKNEFDACNSHA